MDGCMSKHNQIFLHYIFTRITDGGNQMYTDVDGFLSEMCECKKGTKMV